MKVSALIAILQNLPPETELYREGGDYKDDYRKIRGRLKEVNFFGKKGVLLE